ncbi:MAG TPA: serpin family protein [Gemmatimonadales bacterium]
MSRRLYHAVLALTVSALMACGGNGKISTEPIANLPRALSAAETDLITADNQFAFALFGAILDEADPDDNVFISPLSVAMALGMTLNGAAGDTRDAMRATLRFTGLNQQQINGAYRSLIDLLRGIDPNVEFLLANSIWYRQEFTIAPAFLELNRTYFDAEVQALDFAASGASDTINGWVDERTNGRIREIVPARLPDDAIMYLINAIYFKGAWTYQFDPKDTRPSPFRLAGGGETQVPMMSQDALPVFHYQDADVEVVDLSYGGGAYRMTIALPDAPGDIAQLTGGLSQARWTSWTAALDSAELLVGIPTFTLETTLSLEDVLDTLGMGVAFCDSGTADFSALYPAAQPGQVCITSVKHKTYVDVNEEGTEAAAVTAVEVGTVSAPLAVWVDRPFVFVIRERLSGTIVFMGRVMNPST